MELATEATGIVASFWLYILGAGFVAFSALIPPIPSTTVFVAFGALTGLTGGPNPGFLVLAMMAGAVAGDLATFGLVRFFGHTRWGMTPGPKRQRAIDAGTRRLRAHPYMFMLTSRFIPLGRLSANMAATMSGYPLRAFAVFSLVSAAIWSVYSVGIGILTQFFPNISTQVAVLIAIVASIVLGWLLGKVSTWYLDRKKSKQLSAVVLPES